MIIYTENIIRNHRKKLIAAALVLVMTVAGGIVFNSLHAEKNEDTGVKLKSISQPVYLCSDDMAEYYKGKFTLDEVKSKKVPPYKAFEFEYSIPTDGDLNIEGRTYALDKSKSKITLDNLLSNHHYSYTVTVGEKSCDGSFDTADTNRFIYMDGAKNTRDIGGYKTESGKRIKQGMIIRGTELDGFIEKDYKLNSDAQSKYFDFKYDMDLRSPSVAKGEYTSPLGKNVKHVFYNAPMYEGALEESSRSTVKRIFDVTVSAVMLVVLAPAFAVIAAAVKKDSKGPVFFRQERVTRYGRHFRIFKFRTMVDNADKMGTQVTVGGDGRITRVGHIIRKYRLDELSQLGTMTIVGTRPEVPKYVEHYTPEMRATLLLPAGVTSEASIIFKDEDKLLESSSDIDGTYVREILPKKMKYNLKAIREFSLMNDMKIMLATVGAVLGIGSGSNKCTKKRKAARQ